MNKPSALRAGILAIRPPTLLVGAGPIILGGLLAFAAERHTGEPFSWLWFVLTLLTGLLLQAGANLVNDVKDAESGVDQVATRLGPPRVTTMGWLPTATVRRMYQVSFALALLLALAVSYHAGMAFLILGFICCAVAYGYTAGPKPFAYIGLGEAMAFLFFGPVAVLGTLAVQTHRVAWEEWPLALAPGFISAAVMAINNVRDRESDRLAGKKTLPLMMGPLWGPVLPHILLAGAIFFPLVRWMSLSWAPSQWSPLSSYVALMLVFVSQFLGGALRPSFARYNLALKRTALFMVIQVLVIGFVHLSLS